MGIIITLIVGGLAGWIASKVMARDAQMGVFANIVVGILGAFLGNLLFAANSDLSEPTLGGFLVAVLGAVLLLAVVNLFTRNKVR